MAGERGCAEARERGEERRGEEEKRGEKTGVSNLHLPAWHANECWGKKNKNEAAAAAYYSPWMCLNCVLNQVTFCLLGQQQEFVFVPYVSFAY